MSVIDIDLMRRWLATRNAVNALVIDQSTCVTFFLRATDGVRSIIAKSRGVPLQFPTELDKLRCELALKVGDLSDCLDILHSLAESISTDLALINEQEKALAQAQSDQHRPAVGPGRRSPRSQRTGPRKSGGRRGGAGGGGVPEPEPPKSA